MKSCTWHDLSADRVEAQVVVAPFFENEKPLVDSQALLDWRLDGVLTNMLRSHQVSGKLGERILVNGGPKIVAAWVMFLGAGPRSDQPREQFEGLLTEALSQCRRAGFSRVGLCFGELAQDARDEQICALCEQLKNPRFQGMECLVTASPCAGSQSG